MTSDLFPTEILNCAERAYAALRDEGDGFVPPSVRDHFNYTVPALIAEVGRLRVLLGEPCPHGHYGVDKAKCGPCSFDAAMAR